MPVDESQLVNPLENTVSPSGSLEIVSPFEIAEVAQQVKDIEPDIGPIEELEGFLSLGTSLLATPVAGLDGLRRQILQDLGFHQEVNPGEMIEANIRAMTYEPRTEGGKAFARRLGVPFEYIDKGAQWVGDRVFDLTGSPGVAANAKAATAFMVPYAAKKTVQGTIKVGQNAVSGVTSAAETLKMISPKARAKYSREAVGQSLRQNIGDSAETMQNIATTKELVQKIPAYKPTLAETTLKPSVAVRERTLAEETQQSFDIAKARRQENINAIEDFRRENFGDMAPEISRILRSTKGNIDRSLSALDNRLVEIDIQRAQLANKAPRMAMDQIGRQLRELEMQEYQTAKAYGEILYNKVGNAKVDPTPVIEKVDSMFKNELLDFSQDQIPSSLKLIKRVLIKEVPEAAPAKTIQEYIAREIATEAATKEPISFDTLRSLEKRLKRDMASEQGKLGRDRETERLLGEVLEQVDVIKENMRQTSDASIVQALDEANAFWKEGVADRFYKGAAKDIDSKTAFGEYRVVDEKVIDSFFSQATKTKGGVKGLDDFINTYGMLPQAWAQLRLGVYQKFRSASGIETSGVIDTVKAGRFFDRHKELLDRIPNIRNELTNIYEANKNLDLAAQAVKARQAKIKHSILADAVKVEHPEIAVKNAIREQGKDMRVLIAMANKVKGGREALSMEVGRQLIEKAERSDGSINAAKMLNEMNKNKSSLKLGMTEKHYNDLYTIYEAYKRIDTNVLPKGVKEPKLGLEKIGQQFGTTPAQAISAWRAKSRGLVGGPHLVAQIATSFITTLNKRQINAIERIAHYDPKVAETLAMMAKVRKVTPAIEKRMIGHVVDYGIVSLSQREE